MAQVIRWHRFADASAVAGEAVQRILGAAQTAIRARGLFKIVLAGGSTPKQVYRLLSKAAAEWSAWHIYLGDERCLPPDHLDRNSVMIESAWLDHVDIPSQQIFWIPAELGPHRGSEAYETVARAALPFDLVVLGIGEDGHTASLFPGHSHDPDRLVVPVNGAPKPPSDRISLNYGALAATRSLLMLITGSGKRAAVIRWRSGEALPVAELECSAGIDVLLDNAACGD
jgi:6-phosphogluconolactonase